ncbi:hypothetical protein QFZ24_002483 [Streptomyces phaeochromogenes]|jgi:hypothetical protein|uniref:DUF6153 family protein n=1 Tax=Streptomyces phaeochromogenes TaxID=1923 RepID=UPI002793C9AB|nr:DUF6153 family protein [Streptomyces phaeochromogenes]MDQ0948560.1 hypothetical protein [Streptomyces phaeochromogenes]
MTMRAAHSGGTAVRWAYGAFLALFVALAVLVHHETSAVVAPSAQRAAHGGMSSMPSAGHPLYDMPDETAPSVSDASPHNVGDSGCAAPGMQHCATASVGSVQLAVPGLIPFDPLSNLRQYTVGCAPGATVGRAPPDLSVLSQLRI